MGEDDVGGAPSVASPGPDAARNERLVRVVWIGVVLVFGGLGVAGALAGPRTHVLTVAATVAVACYLGWFAWRWPHPDVGGRPVVVLAVGVVGWTARLALPEDPNVGFALLAPAALAATVWRLRPVWPAAAALVLAGAPLAVVVAGGRSASEVWDHHGEPTVLILAVELLVFLTVATSWAWYQRWEEDRVRERDLVLARERLRFAADLHDVQGHTLLAIKFKTELARRSLDGDVERSRAELASIEQLVVELEAQTRQIAQNSRQTSPALELGNLQALLAAAGIETRVDAPGRSLDLWDEEVALVLREAASNVLRHADASRVDVVVREDSLTVVNDGVLPSSREPGTGRGLHGLRDRLAAGGAVVDWGCEGDVFTVRVTRRPQAAAGGPA